MTLRDVFLWSAALLAVGCQTGDVGPGADTSSQRRAFRIRYVTDLTDLPLGETVRLWIPIPHDDPHQRIAQLQVEAPWPHTAQVESVHGNHMLYLEGPATAPEARVTVSYEVERAEVTTDLAAFANDGEDDRDRWSRYLAPTRLVVVDDSLRSISSRVAPPQGGTLATARAYYDHVLGEMAYDKSGEGWGRGDSLYACSAGTGNCTDFHSYFKSLCMAAGIPTRFQIGMWGDYARRPGEEYQTGSYHCWAEFYVPGRGWVPVDISEADKAPAKADYFFGSHSDNRCTLSTGRDVVLEPAQDGPPLNYFVDPYAEVGGRPHPGVGKTPYWTDLR
jgi:transglutaminase-like putative cysteine protease